MALIYNPAKGQRIKTDITGDSLDRGFIARYTIAAADAVAPSTTYIKTAVTLADGSTTTVLAAALTHQPPTPRVLSITGNAASAVGNVVIAGKNAAGESITDTIISTGAATVAGTKAFASITSIVLPARGAPGDTIAIGLHGAFGIPYKLPHDTVIKILNNGAATTVAAGSAFSATVLCGNFIVPTAALNAAQIDVYLIV